MPTNLVIFGTSSFAEVAYTYFTEDSPYHVAAFTVNEEFIKEKEKFGVPVVPFESITETFPPGTVELFVAVGYRQVNQARAGLYRQCKDLGYRMASYVHSSVVTFSNTRIGEHCFIFDENNLQPFVTVGDNVIMWSGNHIGHHSAIGDHCFLASHIVVSGHCTIGEYTFIGVNASFRDGITVGARNIIGMGAIISKDTEDDAVHAAPHTEAHSKKSYEIRSFQ